MQGQLQTITAQQAIDACERISRRYVVKCYSEKWLTYKIWDNVTREWVADTEGVDLTDMELTAQAMNINDIGKAAK